MSVGAEDAKVNDLVIIVIIDSVVGELDVGLYPMLERDTNLVGNGRVLCAEVFK